MVKYFPFKMKYAGSSVAPAEVMAGETARSFSFVYKLKAPPKLMEAHIF